ncbi:hypothetical protein GCM10023322_33250 [Rugosimonospora acidiphila]|uniref:YbaB/EbfC DNA-binding family protein n=1 Tax=Rugosimonospora acidiphila TaxID=556531 RepID=A0ABP9RUA1_9ACTN
MAAKFPLFGDEAALDDAGARVDGWLAGIEDRAARARALSGLVAELTATASNADRSITITVDSSGLLSGVTMDDAVRRHSGQWIAQEVLATTRKAVARLADRIGGAVDETVGRDSPEGRAVTALFQARVTGGSDGR